MSYLSSQDVAVLDALLEEGKQQTIREGDTVLRASRGEPKAALIASGLVKVQCVLISSRQKDKPVTSGLFADRQWLGVEAVYDGDLTLGYRALTDVSLVTFSSSFFTDTMSEAVQSTILKQTLRSNAFNSARMLNIKTPPHLRLLLVLIELVLFTGKKELPITLQDMSDLTGMPKTTLSPLMRTLEKEGLLQRGYKKYTFADPKDMQAYFKDQLC